MGWLYTCSQLTQTERAIERGEREIDERRQRKGRKRERDANIIVGGLLLLLLRLLWCCWLNGAIALTMCVREMGGKQLELGDHPYSDLMHHI